MPSFNEVAEGLRMPLVEAMETQRAIRRLRPDPVDDETVLELVRLATKAPTGSNSQGWEFVVVRDPEVKHQLARLNRQSFALYRRVARWVARRDPKSLRALDAVQWQADHFEEIPVVVVACLHGPRWRVPTTMAASWYGSVFPSVQNLLLAARALGLGATLTTLPLWSATLVKRTLGLPAGVHAVAVVPLGWPTGRYGPTTRRPPEAVTHLDRYGIRPFPSRTGVPAEVREERADLG